MSDLAVWLLVVFLCGVGLVAFGQGLRAMYREHQRKLELAAEREKRIRYVAAHIEKASRR